MLSPCDCLCPHLSFSDGCRSYQIKDHANVSVCLFFFFDRNVFVYFNLNYTGDPVFNLAILLLLLLSRFSRVRLCAAP